MEAYQTKLGSLIRLGLHAVNARMPLLVCIECVQPLDEVSTDGRFDDAFCDRCGKMCSSDTGVSVRLKNEGRDCDSSH
jgi:hypothetical protein